MRYSIVLADSQRLVRESLRAMMGSRRDLEVVGETDDGHHVVELCLEQQPDVVVLDAQLSGLPGIEAVRQIRSHGGRTRCVVTSGSCSSRVMRAALLAGASAFVPKTSTAGELFEAIEAARMRQPFFLRSVGRSLSEALGGVDLEGDDPSMLTPRQVEVLQLVAEGMSTRQIAARLGVSTKTAQTHREKLMKKVGAHKVSDLVRYAIREGIVSV